MKFQGFQELCARNRNKDQMYISIINHSNMKGHKETFWIMEVFVICINVMVLQAYTNLNTSQVAYFKYMKLITFQLCFN